MKKLFIVEMSDSKLPIFPESCVVCNRPKGEQLRTMKMSSEHGRVDFYLYNLVKKNAQGYFLDIPAHDKCIIEVRNKFLKRFLLILSFTVLVGVICNHYNFSGFFAMIAFIFTMPLLFNVPVPLEYEYYSNKFNFTFRDRNYAEHFAALNNVTMKEKD